MHLLFIDTTRLEEKSLIMLYSGRFVVFVSIVATTFAIVFFILGITTVYNGNASATITFAISVLVAFVPQGLPSVVTLLYVQSFYMLLDMTVLTTFVQTVNRCEANGGATCPSEGFTGRGDSR